jgi:xanthine/uracil/vitamin C permease (AzgA family)
MATIAGRRSGALEGYFHFTDRGSSLRTEIVAGATTWMTMAWRTSSGA